MEGLYFGCPLCGRKKHKQGDNTFTFFPSSSSLFPEFYHSHLIHQLSTAPSVAVIDVEHHDCNVLVVVVVLLRLVHELCLHLDDAVKGLVGDQGLVPDVQLQEGCRPAPGTISTSLCLYIAQLYTDG